MADDLDALVNQIYDDIGFDDAPAPAAAAAPAAAVSPAGDEVDETDVDSLMAQLGIEATAAAAAPAPAAAAAPAAAGGSKSGKRTLPPGACTGPADLRQRKLKAGGPAPFNPAKTTPDGRPLKFNGPPCATCGYPIAGKIFSVGDKKYHPECFVCFHCKRLLLQTEPFMEEEGNVYCQDCYYENFGDVCYVCKKPVLEECIEFGDRLYHPEHFACTECGTSLLKAQYKEDEGDPYCVKCCSARVRLREGKYDICAKCKKPILGDYMILNGQKIHPEHYRCEACGAEFIGGNCKEHNGKNYCLICYTKLVKDVCAGCGKPILGRSILALMRTWHPECLCCCECGVNFSSGKYFESDKKAYCSFHYYKKFGKICPRCQQVIEGEGIEAIGMLFHPDCFTCHGCSKDLRKKGEVYDYESKPLCKSCFGKLPKEVRKVIEKKLEATKKARKEEEKQKKREEKEAKKRAKE